MCENCVRPIPTNQGSMEAGVYGRTRGTCFVARRLEVVAVAGLLWISLCVLCAAGFRVIVFRFIFLERPRPAPSSRPPPACRLQGFLPQCFEQSYRRTYSRNHLLYYCFLHSRPSWDLRTVAWYGSTAVQLHMLLMSTAATSCYHNT